MRKFKKGSIVLILLYSFMTLLFFAGALGSLFHIFDDVEAKSKTANTEATTVSENVPELRIVYVNSDGTLVDPPEECTYRNMGEFNITGYDSCEQCCGKWAEFGITKDGSKPIAGFTIAVDPDIIPIGSIVEINGHEYFAEDTGNFSGNAIDIYFNNHEEIYAYMKKYGTKAQVRVVDYSCNDEMWEDE